MTADSVEAKSGALGRLEAQLIGRNMKSKTMTVQETGQNSRVRFQNFAGF